MLTKKCTYWKDYIYLQIDFQNNIQLKIFDSVNVEMYIKNFQFYFRTDNFFSKVYFMCSFRRLYVSNNGWLVLIKISEAFNLNFLRKKDGWK